MPQPTITLAAIEQPAIYLNAPSVVLNNQTIEERLRKVLQGMVQQNLDSLVVYADKEHGGNFEYLTGFIPRFEEGLLVLHKSGEAVLVLGNENLKLAQHSRIPEFQQLWYMRRGFHCQTNQWTPHFR